LKGFPKTEQISVTDEEMRRLYLDGKSIRKYCIQCHGPKLMMPSDERTDYRSSSTYLTEIPAKYLIFCGTCGAKYTAKLIA